MHMTLSRSALEEFAFEAFRHGIRFDCADVLRQASQPAVGTEAPTYSRAA